MKIDLYEKKKNANKELKAVYSRNQADCLPDQRSKMPISSYDVGKTDQTLSRFMQNKIGIMAESDTYNNVTPPFRQSNPFNKSHNSVSQEERDEINRLRKEI